MLRLILFCFLLLNVRSVLKRKVILRNTLSLQILLRLVMVQRLLVMLVLSIIVRNLFVSLFSLLFRPMKRRSVLIFLVTMIISLRLMFV